MASSLSQQQMCVVAIDDILAGCLTAHGAVLPVALGLDELAGAGGIKVIIGTLKGLCTIRFAR